MTRSDDQDSQLQCISNVYKLLITLDYKNGLHFVLNWPRAPGYFHGLYVCSPDEDTWVQKLWFLCLLLMGLAYIWCHLDTQTFAELAQSDDHVESSDTCISP